MRDYSSVHTQQPADPVRDIDIDPYIMLDDDIKYVTQDIRDVSSYTQKKLKVDLALKELVCYLPSQRHIFNRVKPQT